MEKYDDLTQYSEEMLDRVSKNVMRIRIEKGYSQLKLALEMGAKRCGVFGENGATKAGVSF